VPDNEMAIVIIPHGGKRKHGINPLNDLVNLLKATLAIPLKEKSGPYGRK
jgi:hypothetical protein